MMYEVLELDGCVLPHGTVTLQRQLILLSVHLILIMIANNSNSIDKSSCPQHLFQHSSSSSIPSCHPDTPHQEQEADPRPQHSHRRPQPIPQRNQLLWLPLSRREARF